MTKAIALMLTCAFAALAQQGSIVNQTSGPPPIAYEKILYYSGSVLQYVCYAPSTSPQTTVTVSAATNANPVVFTATAHGFGDFATAGATTTPTVQISGGTGNWAAVNGVWKATVTSANAFSIPVDSTTFGAFVSATVITRAPRWNQTMWSISINFYDASNNLIGQGWAGAPAGAASTTLVGGSTTPPTKDCSQRASYSYQ
jgi:hypothetical protein